MHIPNSARHVARGSLSPRESNPAGSDTRVSRLSLLILTAGVLASFLAACAPAPRPADADRGEAQPADLSTAELRWWYERFRITWPGDTDPQWHLDALIADQVIGPALDRHEREIALWRFHRRAMRDKAGHRFSFIFYSTPETARAIHSETQENLTVRALAEGGHLQEVDLNGFDGGSDNGIAGTSDGKWPRTLRAAWPRYLMGASAAWLSLVRLEGANSPVSAADLEATLERYRGINEAVTAIWREHGQHAFIHHLNALFGYEALIIREEMRF